ncbi:MAG: cupin, partial [Hyphomicrobiaceae bacterium]|nr:cupin [Hyphomicrobiaceae bacterium]
MSQLQIFGDSDANALLMETDDPERIALELAGIGVRFERWPTRPVASADDVLSAYAPEIEKLVAADG